MISTYSAPSHRTGAGPYIRPMAISNPARTAGGIDLPVFDGRHGVGVAVERLRQREVRTLFLHERFRSRSAEDADSQFRSLPDSANVVPRLNRSVSRGHELQTERIVMPRSQIVTRNHRLQLKTVQCEMDVAFVEKRGDVFPLSLLELGFNAQFGGD